MSKKQIGLLGLRQGLRSSGTSSSPARVLTLCSFGVTGGRSPRRGFLIRLRKSSCGQTSRFSSLSTPSVQGGLNLPASGSSAIPPPPGQCNPALSSCSQPELRANVLYTFVLFRSLPASDFSFSIGTCGVRLCVHSGSSGCNSCAQCVTGQYCTASKVACIEP